MIPPAKKSPSDLALDIVAGSPGKSTSSSSYGDEFGGGEEEEAQPEQPSDPVALLDKIQSNIDQLRASI